MQLKNLITRAKETFNTRIYRSRIYEWLGKEICEDDVRFLSNQIASAYKKVKDPNISHFRLCRAVDGLPSEEYRKVKDSGCCGFIDCKVTNPINDHTYYFGFNYGH